MADHFKQNELVTRTVTFLVGSTPTDPGAVTAKLKKPDGTAATYVYPTHPELTRSSAGVYLLKVTGDQVGHWDERFEGTAPVSDVQEGEFYVDPSAFDAVSELATNALTTVDRAEVFLDRVGIQIGEKEEEEDRWFLTILINGFSSAIHRYTQREFKPKTSSPETRTFSYDGGGYLTLGPYEARTITAVVVYANDDGERTLLVTEWKGRPRQKSLVCGTFLWLEMPTFSLPHCDLSMDVEVTGDWGAAAVPAEVELACLVAVANAYQRQEDFQPRVMDEIEISEVGEGGVPGEDNRFALPRSARRLLDPFKRVGR